LFCRPAFGTLITIAESSTSSNRKTLDDVPSSINFTLDIFMAMISEAADLREKSFILPFFISRLFIVLQTDAVLKELNGAVAQHFTIIFSLAERLIAQEEATTIDLTVLDSVLITLITLFRSQHSILRTRSCLLILTVLLSKAPLIFGSSEKALIEFMRGLDEALSRITDLESYRSDIFVTQFLPVLFQCLKAICAQLNQKSVVKNLTIPLVKRCLAVLTRFRYLLQEVQVADTRTKTNVQRAISDYLAFVSGLPGIYASEQLKRRIAMTIIPLFLGSSKFLGGMALDAILNIATSDPVLFKHVVDEMECRPSVKGNLETAIRSHLMAKQ
jgi:hypothetical protein